MKQPLVSICIPTFNGSGFLEDALVSAISQTYQPLEIIVSDDASVDHTICIVESFRERTGIPIFIFNHKPEGIGANWNNTVIHSNGEYIKFLFQDDLMHPDCISVMMEAALQHSEIGLVFCKRKILGDVNSDQHQLWTQIYGDLHMHWCQLLPVQNGRALLRDPALLKTPRNKVGEPVAVLLKREVFKQVGPFNLNLVQELDYEFYYRVFTSYKVAFVDQYLVTFRLHRDQASVKNRLNDIVDDHMIPELIYRNCFPYLHPGLKTELLLKCHPVLKSLSPFLRLFFGNNKYLQ